MQRGLNEKETELHLCSIFSMSAFNYLIFPTIFNCVKLEQLSREFLDDLLYLQSVTKYVETWSKPINIFETFERVQYMPILMPPPPTLCSV